MTTRRPSKEKVDEILRLVDVLFADDPRYPGMAVPYGSWTDEMHAAHQRMDQFSCAILADEVRWLRARLGEG